jgi:hypothetical protein
MWLNLMEIDDKGRYPLSLQIIPISADLQYPPSAGNFCERARMLKTTSDYLKWLIFTLTFVTLFLLVNSFVTIANAQSISVEVLETGKTSEFLNRILSEDDSVVELKGNTLFITTSLGTTRQVVLPLNVPQQSPRVLGSTFLLKSDGKALIAPSSAPGHTRCEFFIVDTFSGEIKSSTYDGRFFFGSKGERTTFCHKGIFLHPMDNVFAIVPESTRGELYLIQYDATVRILLPSLPSDINLSGAIGFPAKDRIVAIYYSEGSSKNYLVQFDLLNSTQSINELVDGNYKFAVIRAVNSTELLLIKVSPIFTPSRTSLVMKYKLDTGEVSAIKEVSNPRVFSPEAAYGDLLLASTAEKSTTLTAFYSSCASPNGGPRNSLFDICVFPESDTQPIPLQCFIPRKDLIYGELFGLIGKRQDRSLLVSTNDQLALLTLPENLPDSAARYCPQITLEMNREARRCLKFDNSPTKPSFKKKALGTTCALTFTITAGTAPVGSGFPVQSRLKKPTQTRGRAAVITTKRTNARSQVTFEIKPRDYLRALEGNNTAIFRFLSTPSLRSAEFDIS